MVALDRQGAKVPMQWQIAALNVCVFIWKRQYPCTGCRMDVCLLTVVCVVVVLQSCAVAALGYYMAVAHAAKVQSEEP